MGSAILITKGKSMERPGKPWSIKVGWKSRDRLKLDLDARLSIMQQEGVSFGSEERPNKKPSAGPPPAEGYF